MADQEDPLLLSLFSLLLNILKIVQYNINKTMQTDLLPLNLNQGILQDFIECPRRFQLKMLDDLPWPAAHTSRLDQFDQSIILGNRFHLLCYQFFSGMNVSDLEQSIDDPILMDMFQSFIPYGYSFRDHLHFSEQLISCSFLKHKLVAKFDLLVEIEPSLYTIIDWKTSPTKPNRKTLSDRIQTILYPFILHQAGHLLTGGKEISAETIQMRYWYPLSSEPEEIFPYSNQIHQDVLDNLTKIISSLNQMLLSGDIFPLTNDKDLCTYCNYRSLCDRGISPGEFDYFLPDEQEDLSNFRFDLENIEEVYF
jgi:hypothetical protein